METRDDRALLTAYAVEGSEEAFAALVHRHISLVYSAARRQLGDCHQAEEVTQLVFTLLARKAARLPAGAVLQGWLFQAVRLTSLRLRRAEARRRRRETEAHMQSSEPEPEPTWEEWSPLLDEAMSRLGEDERDAILLRYFEGRSFADAALALHAKEGAVQKRASRGLEKLRAFFVRRGIAMSTGALAAGLAAHSLQAAPASFAASVAAASVTGAAGAGGVATLLQEILKLMAWTKAKTALIAAGAVLCVGTATVALKDRFQREPYYKGKSVTEWIRQNSDPDHAKRWEAFQTLREMGEPALPYLVREFQDASISKRESRTRPDTTTNEGEDDPRTEARVNAAHVLREFGPAGDPAIPALLAGLKDPSDAVRHASAFAFDFLNPDREDVALALLDAYEADFNRFDPSWELKLAMGGVFRPGSKSAARLTPRLIGLLERQLGEGLGRADRVLEILAWLGATGARAAAAIPTLEAIAGEADARVALAAEQALWQIDPHAIRPATTVATIQMLLAGDRARLAGVHAAAWAAERFPREAAALQENLLALSQEADPTLAAEAILALGRFPNGTNAIPQLESLAMEGDLSTRLRAAETLWKLRARPKDVLDVFADAIQDSDKNNHRASACRVLAELGPAGKPAVPALKNLLVTGEAGERMWAAQALWRIERDPQPVLPVVIEAMSQRGSFPGSWAAKLIVEMGPAAKPALPALRRLVEDRQAFAGVHEEAAAALAQLDPQAAASAVRVWSTPGGKAK